MKKILMVLFVALMTVFNLTTYGEEKLLTKEEYEVLRKKDTETPEECLAKLKYEYNETKKYVESIADDLKSYGVKITITDKKVECEYKKNENKIGPSEDFIKWKINYYMKYVTEILPTKEQVIALQELYIAREKLNKSK